MHGCCVDKKYGKGCTPATCMELPIGKTCGDCVQVERCEAFLGDRFKRSNTACDWFPRAFRERASTKDGGQ